MLLSDYQHYTVEVDKEGCPHCGAETYWTVVGDEIAIGQSFGRKEDAEELAEYMNEAFRRGYQKHSEINVVLD